MTPDSQEAFEATTHALPQELSEQQVSAKVLKIATRLFSQQTALNCVDYVRTRRMIQSKS